MLSDRVWELFIYRITLWTLFDKGNSGQSARTHKCHVLTHEPLVQEGLFWDDDAVLPTKGVPEPGKELSERGHDPLFPDRDHRGKRKEATPEDAGKPRGNEDEVAVFDPRRERCDEASQGIEVSMEVVLRYGKHIPTLIHQTQEMLKAEIERITGMVVQEVNIMVRTLYVGAT